MYEGFDQSFWLVGCVVFRYVREYQVVLHVQLLHCAYFHGYNVHGGLEEVIFSLDFFDLVVGKLKARLHVMFNKQVKFSVNGWKTLTSISVVSRLSMSVAESVFSPLFR